MLTSAAEVAKIQFEEVNMAKSYPAKLKFQIVLEALQSEKPTAQIVKALGAHPNSLSKWKRELMANGAEVFAKKAPSPSMSGALPIWSNCSARKRSRSRL